MVNGWSASQHGSHGPHRYVTKLTIWAVLTHIIHSYVHHQSYMFTENTCSTNSASIHLCAGLYQVFTLHLTQTFAEVSRLLQAQLHDVTFIDLF